MTHKKDLIPGHLLNGSHRSLLSAQFVSFTDSGTDRETTSEAVLFSYLHPLGSSLV